jgi:glutaredoxin 3
MTNNFARKIFLTISVLAITIAILKFYHIWDEKLIVDTDLKLPKYTKIVLYTKNGCSYCTMAKDLLDKSDAKYDIIDISNNKDLHLKLANQTNQTTVPYVFIDDKFIGGYTELRKLTSKSGDIQR